MSEVMTVRENNDIRIVDVNGDLASYAAVHLRKKLELLVRQRIYKLIVNLSNSESINSRSVSVLFGIAVQVRQQNGDLKICGLTGILRRTFDLLGTSKVLEVYSSEADAIASFYN
ncbi:MAG: STAS domain-containing protein [Methanomicrobia archaeon]|nr:STAS domain-containing protein [Methanomicrobia archaeon]